MTSINAIKFDEYSGACVCDEARCWNDESMKIFTADKIKPCVPEEITRRYGTVGAYGNTGTSTIGDEIKWTITKYLKDEWEKQVEKKGQIPPSFLNMEEIGELVYKVICDVKHLHINDQLQGRFGFSTGDFVRGFYKAGDKKIEIHEKDVIETVQKFLTWKDMFEEARPVFLNAGILAGYEETQGFRLFHYSLIEGFYEPVQAAFIVDGSGRDMAGSSLADYFSRKTLPERGSIDPTEGMIAILSAVNSASRTNLGVEGYFNIILINGKEKDYNKRLIEINDHRSKLASEIVSAGDFHLITMDSTYHLIKGLFFEEKPYPQIAQQFIRSAISRPQLSRFLRGYKVLRSI